MKSSKDKATPRPWHDNGCGQLMADDPVHGGMFTVADFNQYAIGDEAIANAAYASRAVNAHDALVEALELARKFGLDVAVSKPHMDERMRVLRVMDAALKLAKEDK